MRRFLLGFMLLAMAIVGCGASSPSATVPPIPTSMATPVRNVTTAVPGGAPTATVPRQSLEQRQNDELNVAEQQWKAKQIMSYEIAVSFNTPFSISPVVMVTTTVQDGRVTASATSCPANRAPTCPAHTPATIPDVFTLARSEIADPHCVTSVTYHAQFSFPQRITCENPPGQFDYQHSISVASFTPAP